MRLTTTINPRVPYQFQLLDETDDKLSFTLQHGSQVLHVALSADGAWPDECYLSVAAVEQRDSESSAEFWGHGPDEVAEIVEPWHMVPWIDDYPPPAWTITPDGQEIDLRIVEGGLF